MDFSFIKLPLLLAESPFRESLDRVWHFFETGGWFMLPVVICSFVAVTLIIMKFFDLRVSAVVPEPLAEKLAHVEELAAAGKLSDVTRSLRENESTLARIARHALLPTHGSREEAERTTALAAEWVAEDLADFGIQPTDTMTGEVMVSRAASALLEPAHH